MVSVIDQLKFALTVTVFLFIACKENDDKTNGTPVPSANEFTNPLLTAAPDPWVEQHEDWYYFTHTTANNLRLYRTENMSDLAQAETKIVWTPPATGMNSKNIWAPEIQFLNG